MEINDLSGHQKYVPNADRYKNMTYKRAGKSGIILPAISLGLWHNFGFVDNVQNSRAILRKAFDLGITHFDLANNYGPPFGSAESNFGTILKEDFTGLRDELFIASKAGYDMWPGPYGNLGSRKYLMASIDQSLKRTGLDYFDIFYHHRPDPDTPLEETMGALADIVRQGKALYVGVSNYEGKDLKKAVKLLKKSNTPFILNQVKYSIFDREVEKDTLDVADKKGVGIIAFSPLAQGMLTNKYIDGIPEGSRAGKKGTYLDRDLVESRLPKIKALHKIAKGRGQTLSQMAVAWLLNQKAVTSVLLGASSPGQLEENLKALDNLEFSKEELKKIGAV